MKITTAASLVLLCSSTVLAHFTLDYPKSRGFNDALEPNAPCGGFDEIKNRTDFPISKGFFTINSHHATAKVKVNVVTGNSPTAADFLAAAGTPAQSVDVPHPDLSCISLDLSSFKGATAGTNATIQIVYDGGDSPLYQCADVTLQTTANLNQTACVNDHGGSPTPSGGSGAPATPTGGSAASTVSVKQTVVASVGLLATALLVL
ncbi:hypothetical protein BG004_000918 [Podila humilis]|nr:hypothetical protein BG004_000918 [Podila humilis]